MFIQKYGLFILYLLISMLLLQSHSLDSYQLSLGNCILHTLRKLRAISHLLQF